MIRKIVSTALLSGAILSSSMAGAAAIVTTKGGLKVFDPDCPYYSFNISGMLRADEVIFFGDYENKQNEFPSGANIRKMALSISGGFGPCLSYDTNFNMVNGFSLDDAFITYTGFREKNVEFSVGQIASPFSLENNLSTKWIPFMERSMATTAFAPDIGLGINLIHWNNWFSINAAAAQPKQGRVQDVRAVGKLYRSDRWTYAAHITAAPYLRNTTVFHIGVSGVFSDNVATFRNGLAKASIGPLASGARYDAYPEIRTRNTIKLLDTANIPNNNSYQYGAEAAFKTGPFWIFGDYVATVVNRPLDLENVSFYGWHVQAAYILTGESRGYVVKNGRFDKIIPCNKCTGAWEVAARYSVLDLNDKDIQGGLEHNTSLSLTWVATESLRFQTNYIYARIHPTSMRPDLNIAPTFRQLNILGLSAQVVF